MKNILKKSKKLTELNICCYLKFDLNEYNCSPGNRSRNCKYYSSISLSFLLTTWNQITKREDKWVRLMEYNLPYTPKIVTKTE